VSPAAGYQFGNVQIEIAAPAGTPTSPLQLVFTVTPPAGSALDTSTLTATEIYRTEGSSVPAFVADCTTSGQALPDGSPCVASRQYVTISGQTYIQLTVLTATASHWNSARPAPGAVSVTDMAYTPQTLVVQPGASVKWNFIGKKSHSVTDGASLGPARSAWFDSALKTTGSYSFAFPAAGIFPYRSAAKSDSMTGSIQVPVVATPTSGRTSSPYSLIWSTRPLPGYIFNVQYRFKAVGANGWKNWTNWKTGVSATSATFTPAQGAGTYAFHAQLRNAATGNTSSYSPDATISVS
jgi:plastocyanin